MKSSRILAAVVLGLALAPASHAEDTLAGALESVSKEQIAAFNKEDVAATMSYAHTKSPTYDAAKETLTEYFKDQDLKAEQVSFQLIGHDDEFAYARIKTKVTGPEGFEGNLSDTVTMFHQEGGKWKVWDAYLFGTTLEK